MRKVLGLGIAVSLALSSCAPERPAPKVKPNEPWAKSSQKASTTPSSLPSAWPKASPTPTASVSPTPSPTPTATPSVTPTSSPTPTPTVTPSPSITPSPLAAGEAFRCQLATSYCGTSGGRYGYWLLAKDSAAATAACRAEATSRREQFCQVTTAQPIAGAPSKATTFVCQLSTSCRDNPTAWGRYEEFVTASDYKSAHIACIQEAIQAGDEFCQISSASLPPQMILAPEEMTAYRCQLATMKCGTNGGRYGFWVMAEKKRRARKACKAEAKSRGDKYCQMTGAVAPSIMPKTTPTEFDCESTKRGYSCVGTLAGGTGREVVTVQSSNVGEAHLKCMVAAENAGGEFCRMLEAR